MNKEDLEDWLDEAIQDSIDMDWTSRVGARAIIGEMEKEGLVLVPVRDVTANPCAGIFDHKWLDPVCVGDGCQSLGLGRVLRALVVAARTTGGTAGRDEGLCKACDEAEALLAKLPHHMPGRS